MGDKDAALRFARARGLVWVCDVSGYTSLLNGSAAGATEDILKRLYWLGCQLVPLAGGKFIKWTGDGFLAWFSVELNRDATRIASSVLRAVWHLSLLCNVTSLGAHFQSKKPRLRHGVTYEQDAVFATMVRGQDELSYDIIGRDVSLAFRLAGIPAEFPSIVGTRTLFASLQPGAVSAAVRFLSWKPTQEEVTRYFKGEKYGVRALCKSDFPKRAPNRSIRAIKRRLKRVIQRAEGGLEADPAERTFVHEFLNLLRSGPSWAQQALEDHLSFMRSEMLGPLKQFVATAV